MSKRCSSETPSGGNDPFSRSSKRSAGEDALLFEERLNGRRDRILQTAIVLAAVVVAAVSARPFLGGFNDASRLATVECLVDYHTLAIDRSIWFADTGDKIRPYRDGPIYSDKPPVLALMLAVPYLALHDGLGLRAADHRAVFCYLMALMSSGLAYVVAVWCVYRLGRVVGLAPGWAAGLTASFGLATVAPAYACQVNSHLPSLAAALAVVLNVAALARPSGGAVGRLLLIGAWAGFAYALEQPTGGLLLAAAAVAAAVRLRRPTALVWVALGALPWAVLHHAVTYAYAGTLGPPNANPDFFKYPGSWFDAQHLTGRWNHADLGAFAAYAFLMLFGQRGFVLSNPTLLLALPAAAWGLRRVETVCYGLWALGVWLVYAALSTNYGGACCTIRWFVPLLAAGYLELALLLRDSPKYRIDFVILSVWGAVLAGCFWAYGPFGSFDYLPWFSYVFWSATAAGLLTWAACRVLAARGAARPQ